MRTCGKLTLNKRCCFGHGVLSAGWFHLSYLLELVITEGLAIHNLSYILCFFILYQFFRPIFIKRQLSDWFVASLVAMVSKSANQFTLIYRFQFASLCQLVLCASNYVLKDLVLLSVRIFQFSSPIVWVPIFNSLLILETYLLLIQKRQHSLLFVLTAEFRIAQLKFQG